MGNEGIKIYRHPNPEIISVILPEEISTYRVEFFKLPISRESKERMKALGKIAGIMTEEIMAIPGIKELHVKPDEIRVKKRPSFEWEDIEDKLARIIKRALLKKRIHLVKG